MTLATTTKDKDMMKHTTFLNELWLLCFCLISFTTHGQSASRTSYFVENSTHKHLLNPALVPERGYLSIPVVGNLYVGTESNMQFTDLIYPILPGEDLPRTFLHKTVDKTNFLALLEPNNYLRTDVRTSLLSLGYYSGYTSFITFDVALRTNVSVNLPYDLFAFLKKGMSSSSGNTYHLNNLNVGASVLGEVALGYSVNLTDALRIGAKAKALIGLARVNAKLTQMDINMTSDEWSVTSQGELDAYGVGLTLVKKQDGVIKDIKFDQKSATDKFGIGGMGMAFDFGVNWSPVKNLDLSMAIVDFGGVKWKRENTHSAEASGTCTFSGIQGINTDSLSELAVEDQIDGLKDDLLEMTKFKEKTATDNLFQRLNPTINAGMEYALFSNRISLGLLYSTRLMEEEQYTEYTGSFNIKPVTWFNLSASYSVLNGNKETFGMALGFIPGLVNIFLCCDYVPTKFNPQYIPLNTLTTNFQLGMSIPLGHGYLPEKH
jgi:hypothetical protein